MHPTRVKWLLWLAVQLAIGLFYHVPAAVVFAAVGVTAALSLEVWLRPLAMPPDPQLSLDPRSRRVEVALIAAVELAGVAALVLDH